MKRFYKDCTTTPQGENAYAIALDGKLVKTPNKELLLCASPVLANLVAQEWAAQGEKIEPEAMPVTQLVTTSIDRVSLNREAIESDLLGYLETDLLLFWTDHPKELHKHQDDLWSPLIQFCAQKMGALPSATTSLSPQAISEETMDQWRSFLANLSPLELTLMAHLVGLGGSLLLAYNFYTKAIDTAQFKAASLCEELFYVKLYNTEHNGLDPQLEKKLAVMERDLNAISAILATKI